ncbi:hypothetical protein [Clostridium tyrobutyricum]|uniref:hypothetical protein n=1 Tax=Clostridium tyrobutyricum TaxID=1519 RepID=UPI002B20B565|nr:hypothetical protein [Clostridium tyrobutyricum]MEA5008769.1 hypothetical protein [Clostridium tyrobutyricum]
MNNEIIKQLPQWIKQKEKYSLCLTNDIDSLMSCYYLTLYKNWHIKAFYDFNYLYATDATLPNECIAVDAELKQGKCIGNHVGEYENNINCININKYCNITRANYNSKFAGSTLVTVLSLLNVDISTFTIEQQEFILAIDTMFKSYFYNKEQATYYIKDILGHPELVDVLENHNKEYFYNIIKKYKLHEDIYLDSWGLLQTDIKLKEINKLFDIKLELPQEDFVAVEEFNTRIGIPRPNEDIFSLAWIYKNKASYSYFS